MTNHNTIQNGKGDKWRNPNYKKYWESEYWNKTKSDKHITQTAAGPVCSKCGRGINCWLGPDESPCQCDS